MKQRLPQQVDDKGVFSLWKALLPIAIGLAVVGWMFYKDAGSENLKEVWHQINFGPRAVAGIILALIFVFGRDFGLSWRFRILTDKDLRWSQAGKVDMLCEFTSCVTPSAVGGSSLGMVFLNSQGIEIGRATTLMVTTLFLDELFFVVTCPFIVLLTPDHSLFDAGGEAFSKGVRLTFWIVYALLALWTFILFCGIIWKPKWIKKTIDRVCSIRLLRRWKRKGEQLGENMVATSEMLRRKPASFWLSAFVATFVSWISRYLLVNALFFGFLPESDPGQWIIFAREMVLWVILMVSPTPGGAGLSEWLFSGYYGDIVSNSAEALILAIFWRILSYYVYLAIGAAVVPSWLKDTMKRLVPLRQNLKGDELSDESHDSK